MITAPWAVSFVAMFDEPKHQERQMKIKELKIERKGNGHDLFVIADGVKIAKRGHPGTPYAKAWVSLEPGWTVVDCPDEQAIEITHKGVRVH